MPDWFYRPVAQRILFQLPDAHARALALGTLGLLGRSQAGRAVIRFLGHMAPDPKLAVTVAGHTYASPLGLGWRVDPEERATQGLTEFGVGCIEVWRGPPRAVYRGAGATLRDAPVELRAATRESHSDMPLLERCIRQNNTEWLRLPGGTELPVVAWTEANVDARRGLVLQVGERIGCGCWVVRTTMPSELPARVRGWREGLPPGAVLIVAGGVGAPEDALTLVHAGADLILIDAGLIYRGPGLVKRCNAALLQPRREASLDSASPMVFHAAWFWACALGAGLVIGGVAALALAFSRVLLPYDEHYLGLTSATLQNTNRRLFDFMAHDRATLAGTMLGLGWLYLVLGGAGIRRGRHEVRTAVIASALTGFASFFSFFGFGYFDALHAFIAAVLFQLTIQVMVGREEAGRYKRLVDHEDASWRRAQWGQLCWIVHSGGLLVAGLTILIIGMSSVFVAEDLEFLCLSPADAGLMDVRLRAVVAHDRATLGGMLLAAGVGSLLPLLWCFERGAHWLWRAMTGLGVPAYVAALGIHFWVGYTDPMHLVPALAGLALWLAGVVTTRSYLRG